MASPTPNKGMTYPAHGGAVNAWDYPLNENFDQLDSNLGGMYNITVTSTATTATYASTGATLSTSVATATIPTSLAQNVYYYVSGALTQNLTVAMPTVGSFYFFNNATTGSSLSVLVGPSGGGMVSVPQGRKMSVVTSSSGAVNGNDANQARFYSYNGNPNTAVPGTASVTSSGLTDATWDFTNRQLYVATTSGSTSAVWSPQLARLVPEGYLTVSNNTTSPVLNVDFPSATSIYYTPLNGNWTLLSNGTFLYPYQFSQMTLTLVAGMAANNIYDVFLWENPTAGVVSPVIGTGPSWAASGGSVTPGTCARGTGAGSTALTRLGGVLVNSVQVTLTNGASTYTCPAGAGVYLGSIWIDSVAGQVTCNRSVGQSRKFGVWNYYNREPIQIIARDSTTSWTYNSTTFRASNGSSLNRASGFCGMAEEQMLASFSQAVQRQVGGPEILIAVGENSITAASGLVGRCQTVSGVGSQNTGQSVTAPKLGIWDFFCLESASDSALFYGSDYMQLSVTYRG